jgi:hypothetical protein
MSQMNPVNAVPFIFCEINFNTILPSMPGFSKWSLSVRVPHQTLHTFSSPNTSHVPLYLILLVLIPPVYGQTAACTHYSPAPVIYEIDLVT